MDNRQYKKVLKEREKELKEELQLVQKLLGKSAEESETTETGQTDAFPVIVEDKTRSTLARVKSAIRKLIDHEVSLQIDDIRANLDKMDIDYNKSSIHNALKALRDKDELVSYKINNSNHYVYYMSPDGLADNEADFPVKPEYRPPSLRPQDVETIDVKG